MLCIDWISMIIATLQGMPWKHTASCMYSFERCPNESQKDDKLMAFLQRDFGPELHLGKRGKSRIASSKMDNFQQLEYWADSIKGINIELGCGHLRTPEDNVQGKLTLMRPEFPWIKQIHKELKDHHLFYFTQISLALGHQQLSLPFHLP